MTTSNSNSNAWGLIAGNGRFPFLVLEGARSQGIEMAVIGPETGLTNFKQDLRNNDVYYYLAQGFRA